MGFDLDGQYVGSLTGLRIEYGEFTASTDVTVAVPTTLHNAIGAVAIGESTDFAWGFFDSVCGSTLDIGITDTTTGTYSYIAWGF